MTVAEIQARQDQLRKNITEKEAILNQLRIERGQLAIADSKKNAEAIKKLDKQIDDRRKDLENFPIELKILQESLAVEQKRLEVEAKDALVAEQQTVANSMEDLSKELVEQLAVAFETNNKLQASIDRYVALASQTGQTLESPNCCQGSQQMLKVIYETCKAEVEGIKSPRTAGQPPFVRI